MSSYQKACKKFWSYCQQQIKTTMDCPLTLPHILVTSRPSPALGGTLMWSGGGKGIPCYPPSPQKQHLKLKHHNNRGFGSTATSFTPWVLSRTSADLQAFWSHDSLVWKETRPKAHHKQRISDICLLWYSWVHHFGLKDSLYSYKLPDQLWFGIQQSCWKKPTRQNQLHIEFFEHRQANETEILLSLYPAPLNIY